MILKSSCIDHLMRSCNLDLHQPNLMHTKMLEHWLDDHYAQSSTFYCMTFLVLLSLQPCLNSSIWLDMSLIQPSLCQVLQVNVLLCSDWFPTKQVGVQWANTIFKQVYAPYSLCIWKCPHDDNINIIQVIA